MLVTRNFRRLPPFVRGLNIVATLLLLVDFALLVPTFLTAWSSMTTRSPSPPFPPYLVRITGIAVNLGLISMACSSVVNVYNLRFRQPAREPLPLASWQSQLRTVALLVVLPLCGLALTLFLPPAFPAFYLVAGIDLLAMVVVLATLMTTYFREHVVG